MDIGAFTRHLSANRERVFSSAQAAFREALCAQHRGCPVSIRETFAQIGDEQVQLQPWARAFLTLASRRSLQQRLQGGTILKLLGSLEDAGWETEECSEAIGRLLAERAAS